MVCEGFKPIGRHTLRRCETSPLDCFFLKRHRTEIHTHKGGNPGLISHNSQHTKPIFNISYKLNLIISIISNQSYQTINF